MGLWGSKDVVSQSSSGEFHCPDCDSPQPYSVNHSARYFCLFSIPLVPAGGAKEYVECGQCRQHYNPNVLGNATRGSQDPAGSIYTSLLTRVMIHVLLADGVVDDYEVYTIQDIYQRITGSEIDKSVILAQIEAIGQGEETVTGTIARDLGSLRDEEKEMIVKAAMFVALSDGEFHEDEQKLVDEIGKSLRLKRSRVRGVVESVKKYY